MDNFPGDRCCVESKNCLYCQTNKECKKCKPGSYGKLCDKTCPKSCSRSKNENVSQCASTDGRCLFGCQDGFYGTSCNETCSDYCIDMICEIGSGVCIKGCYSQHEDPVCSLSRGEL